MTNTYRNTADFSVAAAQMQSNGMGLAGFIVSLVGLFASCGLISPVGLVMSLVGLRREPRGLAIAGVVIGLIGSIWLFIALAFGLFAAILAAIGIGAAATAVNSMADIERTERTLASVRQAVVEYEADAGKPAYAVELLEPTFLTRSDMYDSWGRALEFSLTPENQYLVRSLGPDGAANTEDDVTIKFGSSLPDAGNSRPTVAPGAVRRAPEGESKKASDYGPL